MTKPRSAFTSTQPCPAPLNLSLSSYSFPPFPLLSFSDSPLPHTTFQPPFAFSSSSSSSSCQAFVLLCRSDTFLKHAEEREKGKTEGERMERRREKRGKVRDKSAGHFLSHCYRERERESESAQREGERERGDQRQTESDRDGEVEKQRKNEADKCKERFQRAEKSHSPPPPTLFNSSAPHFLICIHCLRVYRSLLLFAHLHISVSPTASAEIPRLHQRLTWSLMKKQRIFLTCHR